jgi:hypothetical protein
VDVVSPLAREPPRQGTPCRVLYVKASDLAATEFCRALDMLGLPQCRVARWFGVSPRHIRRWRSGSRRLPHAVGIVCNLLTWLVTIEQVERVAFLIPARTNGGAKPAPRASLEGASQERSLRLAVKTPVAATLADPGVTTAEKVYRLMPGTCRWCEGDPQRPDFRFCGRPVVVQPYCEEHCRTAYLAPLVDSAASKWLFHLRRRTTSAAGRLPVTIPST